MKQTIQIGDAGSFYPYGVDGKPGVRHDAKVIHVWSDTCVNLRTAEGFTPTSVLVWPADREDKAPSGYYFVPHAKAAVDPIEAEIQAKGLTAPRVTPDDLQANIVLAYYFTGDEAMQFAGQNGSPFVPHPALKLLTFCVLVLRNGFTVTGESAVASPENFDADIGKRIARANAEQKIWPLMGYALRSNLAAQQQAQAPAPADCPHAAPHRYCEGCKVSPCPIGLG